MPGRNIVHIFLAFLGGIALGAAGVVVLAYLLAPRELWGWQPGQDPHTEELRVHFPAEEVLMVATRDRESKRLNEISVTRGTTATPSFALRPHEGLGDAYAQYCGRHYAWIDLNGDGLLDVRVHFDGSGVQIRQGDSWRKVKLTGGNALKGSFETENKRFQFTEGEWLERR